VVWLLVAQSVQMEPLDILHQDVDATEPVITQDLIDTRERFVRKPSEQCAFEEEPLLLLFVEVPDLLEDEEAVLSLLDTLISHQVNSIRGILVE